MKRITFFILCFEGAILSFNVAASAAAIPTIALDFGISDFIVGRIVWIYMLSYGLAAVFYGPLIRLVDARKVELVCMLFFSLSNLLIASCRSLSLLFLGRFLMGVFGASVVPLALILISRHLTENRRAKALGIFFSSSFLSSFLGLTLSGFCHWRIIFLLPAIAGLFLFVAMFFYLPSFKGETSDLVFNYLGVFKEKRVISIFLYIFFASLLYHSLQQWLSVYFSQVFGFVQPKISFLLTLVSLSGIVGESVGGFWADNFGRLKTINLGTFLMFLSTVLLLIKTPFFALAVIMLIWGSGWAFNHVGVSALLADLPYKFVPEVAGLNSSLRFLAGGIGMFFSGYIMSNSFSFGFISCSFGLLFLLLWGRKWLNWQ